MCSTIHSIFNLYSTFNAFNFPFNIHLFILYSIPYSPIQLSIQQFQPFSQHSTIHSTFNYSFNIQLFIQHSTVHSTFNCSFNIQLFIQHSTIHSSFNYSFNIQLFIQHSTLIQHSTVYSTFNYSFNIQLFIQHSTIHSSLLSPHYFWSVTQIIGY